MGSPREVIFPVWFDVLLPVRILLDLLEISQVLTKTWLEGVPSESQLSRDGRQHCELHGKASVRH